MAFNGFIEQGTLCQVSKGGNCRLDEGEEDFYHPVSAVFGDAGMEFNILFDMVFPAGKKFFHFIAQRGKFFPLFLGGILAGEEGNFGFQHETDIEKLQGQFVFILKFGKAQGVFFQCACTDDISAGTSSHL